PMQLVDDLLDVAADERLEDREIARVAAHALQRGIDISRPLHEPHDAAELRVRAEPVEQIPVAEALGMRHAGRPMAIEPRRDLGDLGSGKDAAQHGIALGAVLRGGRSERIRRNHGVAAAAGTDASTGGRAKSLRKLPRKLSIPAKSPSRGGTAPST